MSEEARSGSVRSFPSSDETSEPTPPAAESDAFLRRFGLGFVAAFALLLGGGCLLAQWKTVTDPLPPLIEKLPRRYFPRLRVPSPELAKRRGYFLVGNHFDGPQEPIDVWRNEDLFASLFPGYRQAREDSELRDRFTRYSGFTFSALSPLVNVPGGPSLGVSWSWPGAVEVFRRYGADIVIAGDSQTFSAVIPAQLASTLEARWSVPSGRLRVLNATLHGMSLTMLSRLAEELAERRKERVAAVLLGISPWLPASGHDYFRPDHQRMADELDAEDTLPNPFRTATTVLGGPTLFDLFPWPRRPVDLRAEGAPPEPGKARRQAHNRQYFWIAKSDGADSSTLRRLFAGETPYHPYLTEASERSCDYSTIGPQLDRILEKLRSASRRIYVFLSPESALMDRLLPACLAKANAVFWEARRSEQVIVHLGGIAEYGLDYADFVHRTPLPDRDIFDMNHTAYDGAVKVTGHLADWMSTGATGLDFRN